MAFKSFELPPGKPLIAKLGLLALIASLTTADLAFKDIGAMQQQVLRTTYDGQTTEFNQFAARVDGEQAVIFKAGKPASHSIEYTISFMFMIDENFLEADREFVQIGDPKEEADHMVSCYFRKFIKHMPMTLECAYYQGSFTLDVKQLVADKWYTFVLGGSQQQGAYAAIISDHF
jgi:hypothetical protein